MVSIADRPDDQQFSDGSTLTGWLVKLGAPALPEGQSYRLEFAEGGYFNPMEVKATIRRREHGLIYDVASYTERTRSNVMGAAVAAAKRACEVRDGA